MHWGLLVSFLIGVICAIRLPILHFTLVVIIGVCIYGFAYHASYASNTQLLLWCIAYGGVLQLGYVFSNCIFYLVYVRTGARKRRNFTSAMRSKYSPD
jgi:uncharacterized protein YqgC (DUF456 family)